MPVPSLQVRNRSRDVGGVPLPHVVRKFSGYTVCRKGVVQLGRLSPLDRSVLSDAAAERRESGNVTKCATNVVRRYSITACDGV